MLLRKILRYGLSTYYQCTLLYVYTCNVYAESVFNVVLAAVIFVDAYLLHAA